jgi:hypothetical protein
MPKPLLQAMVLADHVYRDGATGKFIIAGTFSTIWFGGSVLSQEAAASDQHSPTEIEGQRRLITGPVTRIGSPYLYVALSEVRGEVPLRLRYVNLADAAVLLEVHMAVTSTDPVAVAEYCFDLPPLDVIHGAAGMTAPGTYSFDLLYEGEILGSWRVIIKRRQQESGAEQPQ